MCSETVQRLSEDPIAMSAKYDVCIIGAGLVGLSVGRALAEAYPGISQVIVEKEDEVGFHQSGHNSGVAHSGLYYKPGSLKARLCVEGRNELARFCEEQEVPFRQPGKLVIATRSSELEALDELHRRGTENGLKGLRKLDATEISECEPAAVGLAALHVPEAGVVDFPMVAQKLASTLRATGAEVLTGQRVEAISLDSSEARITTADKEIRASVAVNCAGLHTDRVAALAGVSTDIRIVPFRGEYYTLTDEAAGLVKSLIYPVPDPRFPFLGVHFTRRVDGKVEVGPNAVLALGREHYRGSRPEWSDVWEVLGVKGVRKLAWNHLGMGASEALRSRSKTMYSSSARSLVPAVRREHLVAGGAGVRAQAVTPDGRMVDDFVIEEAGPTVHVLNAPSPGATSCLAIGRHIATLVSRHF